MKQIVRDLRCSFIILVVMFTVLVIDHNNNERIIANKQRQIFELEQKYTKLFYDFIECKAYTPDCREFF